LFYGVSEAKSRRRVGVSSENDPSANSSERNRVAIPRRLYYNRNPFSSKGATRIFGKSLRRRETADARAEEGRTFEKRRGAEEIKRSGTGREERRLIF
jgi:hypothetical protein